MTENTSHSATGAGRKTASGLHTLARLLARQAAQRWKTNLKIPESSTGISLLQQTRHAEEHENPTSPAEPAKQEPASPTVSTAGSVFEIPDDKK